MRDFKDVIDRGAVEIADREEKTAAWREYLREFSGSKGGPIQINLDYVSYHGDVVDALKSRLDSRLDKGAAATNSPLIDLLVHKNGALTDVFEVKTNAARQTLYTAIGQLVVHSASAKGARRHLVLPEAAAIPQDIRRALDAWEIEVLKFRISPDDTIELVD